MRSQEKSSDRMNKICDRLLYEVIHPAKQEAQTIIDEANQRAAEIIAEAEAHADHLLHQARGAIEQEKKLFHSSLEQGGKQAIESLRQQIESELFSHELQQLLRKDLAEPKTVAKLINAIVEALEKEGIKGDITAFLPPNLSSSEVVEALVERVKQRLKRENILIGNFAGGAQIELKDQRLLLDITDQAIQDLLTRYIRKDFRKIFFGS